MARPAPIPRAQGPGAAFGVLLVGTLFAALAGAGTAFAGPYAAAAFSAVLLGIVALFLPIRWMILALLLVSFIITGQLIYFARIEKALWFPFLVGALMLARFPLDRMQRGSHPQHEAEVVPSTPAALTVCIALYFATLFASTLINRIPPLQMLVSFKEYLFLWGLYLVLAAGLVRPQFVARIWAWLPWLAVPQLPIVVYQRFVVAPARRGIGAEWDSVVGLFGGDPNGGGANAAMGMFCVFAMLVPLTRWRRGFMPGWQAALIAACGLISIVLAEVKFMILILPLGFALVFLREFARRPWQGILAFVLGLAVAGSVLVSYKMQYGNARHHQTVGEYFTSMFSASTDVEFVNLRTREIGRFAAIKFWYDQHDLREPLRLFIGHGAGASRVGANVVGEAAKPWPFNIARSALALLLWETGLIGTLAFIAVFAVAAWRAFRLALDDRLDEDMRSTLVSMGAALVLLASTLPYTTDLLYSHQTQVLLMLCLGYVVVASAIARSAPPVPCAAVRHLRAYPLRFRP